MKDIKIVIGANYGDEGKGLMTDYFAHKSISSGNKTIVVCSNGGAQRGHTVRTPENYKHVFHHFGSGTLVGAYTYLPNQFIVNPMLFYKEYKVAACIRPLLKERFDIEIDEHEIGYIALHVHSAIVDENVSQAMEIARAVRESISLVEQITGNSIDVMSLSYNRLMNHIRCMVARIVSGEKLKMNINDYMSVKFPEAFQAAQTICDEISQRLKLPVEEVEIGYLAMHMERMMDREEEEE